MYNRDLISKLVEFIKSKNGINDKMLLSSQVKEEFVLVKDRSVFYCDWFAIRFSKSNSRVFGNTVLSLSNLQKYDKVPFFVCLVTPDKNYLMMANTSFIKKISHSSQELRVNNIKGSFNGSDIIKDYAGKENSPENFEFLFSSHENFTFAENLERLVESTNNIVPTGSRFAPNSSQAKCILNSVKRAVDFMGSQDYITLDKDLSNRVNKVQSEIAIAALIDNVNLRGRVIEFLITAPNDLKDTLIEALQNNNPLPELYTADKLGDYERIFPDFNSVTDIKTKILFLSSNPKGYNIDKFLSFLSEEKSVYLIYIIGIDKDKNIKTSLCSVFNKQLLNGTRVIKHWAGRNSRGVTQYNGLDLENIVTHFDKTIDVKNSMNFIIECLAGNCEEEGLYRKKEEIWALAVAEKNRSKY